MGQDLFMFTPNYTISNNLVMYIASIQASKEVIDNAPLVPAWTAKFKNEAKLRSAFYGTQIEGNELTKEQAQQLVHLEKVKDAQQALQQTGMVAPEKDVQEVINYREVLAWIDSWQDFIGREVVYSQDILKQLHALIMQKLVGEEQTGKYRTKQVVVRSAESGEVVFKPPVSVEIPHLLEAFFEWLNSQEARSIHPSIRAAITHYELVRIHPFIEGNGRTARAFALLVLYAEGYDIKRFFSLDEYFNNDIDGYYEAIASVQAHQEHEMTYWVEYFCYGLAVELDRVKHKVLKLSKDVQLQSKLGKQVALSERQIILIELLQNQGEITSSDASKVLPDVSVDTILRDLKDLMNKGVVEKHGVTKGVSYSLAE